MYQVSESDKIRILKTCRICMDSTGTKSVNLDVNNGWLQLYEYCFNLQVSSQEQPQVICQKCAEKVQSYAKFKKQCYKSNEFWKSLNYVNDNVVKTEVDKIDENLNDEKDITDCIDIDNDFVNEQIEQLDSDSDNKIEDIKEIDSDSDILEDIKEIENERNSLNESSNNETKTDIIKHKHYTRSKGKIDFLKEECESDTFNCKNCGRNFVSSVRYRRHVKLCIKDKDQSTVFKNTEDNSDNNDIDDHFCGLCKYSSNCVDDLNKHLDEHWTNKDLQCRLCDFTAKDEAAIVIHRYKHKSMKKPVYQCHICQHKARSVISIEFHCREVHLNKIGGLCSNPNCSKEFKSWRIWKKHEMAHNMIPKYICDYCGKKFKFKLSLVDHLLIHTNAPSYVCDVCGKAFYRLRNMKLHISNVHTKHEPIKCTCCNRMFKNELYLRRHLHIEAMEKKWKCEFCPMEYSLLSNLKSHLMGHSDERPHCCHVCGASYKRKSQLTIHMRNHTGYRPFNCRYCSRTFTNSNHLKGHTIKHTGILPYKCLHCVKAFRSKQRMLKHCAVTHGALQKKL